MSEAVSRVGRATRRRWGRDGLGRGSRAVGARTRACGGPALGALRRLARRGLVAPGPLSARSPATRTGASGSSPPTAGTATTAALEPGRRRGLPPLVSEVAAPPRIASRGMERVLLLNATYEPLALVSDRRAVVLMLAGRPSRSRSATTARSSTRPGWTSRCRRSSGSAPHGADPALGPHAAGDPALGAAARRRSVRLLLPAGRHHRPRDPAQPGRHARLVQRGGRLQARQPRQGRPAALGAGLDAAGQARRRPTGTSGGCGTSRTWTRCGSRTWLRRPEVAARSPVGPFGVEQPFFDVERSGRGAARRVVRAVARPTLVLGSTQPAGARRCLSAMRRRRSSWRRRRGGGGAVYLEPGRPRSGSMPGSHGTTRCGSHDVSRRGRMGRRAGGVQALVGVGRHGRGLSSAHRTLGGRARSASWSASPGRGPGEVFDGRPQGGGLSQWRAARGRSSPSCAYLALGSRAAARRSSLGAGARAELAARAGRPSRSAWRQLDAAGAATSERCGTAAGGIRSRSFSRRRASASGSASGRRRPSSAPLVRLALPAHLLFASAPGCSGRARGARAGAPPPGRRSSGRRRQRRPWAGAVSDGRRREVSVAGLDGAGGCDVGLRVVHRVVVVVGGKGVKWREMV